MMAKPMRGKARRRKLVKGKRLKGASLARASGPLAGPKAPPAGPTPIPYPISGVS